MRIVVIGAGGLIAAKLVSAIGDRGHQTVAASPETGVDTLTGEGVAAALMGAGVVVDVSTAPSLEDAAVLEFLDRSTRNLLAAEAAAGVAHHVAVSVVDNGRPPADGYLRARRAQERLIEQSSIPYSIVRAAQPIRPEAADDVADALGRIAMGSPLNGVVELPSPHS